MELLKYWIERSTEITESNRELFQKEIAELEEYKQLYNSVAAKLNTANNKLSQIITLAEHESGLTIRAADLPKAGGSISVTCPHCGTFIGVDFGKSASG